MSVQPETRFQQSVQKRLRIEFPKAFVHKNQAGSILGIPDISMCLGGFFIALELKMPGNKPTKLQLHRVRQITVAGGYARVVYPKDLEHIIADLKGLLNDRTGIT